MVLSLPVPRDFEFRRAVCSHGWFVLAPNRWDPCRAVLETVIPLGGEAAAAVRVRAARGRLLIDAPSLPHSARIQVRRGVARMLRLDEDLSGFHRLCRASPSHHDAAKTRFGRLLRGESLFEDMVKVICTCNVAWRQTVSMVERLVGRWGAEVRGGDGQRAFPTPESLARARVDELRAHARLGYRAGFVSRLARDVCAGCVNPAEIEAFAGPTPELQKMLREIHGIGPYAASNLCMLLGRYDCLAIDTELTRFLRERYPRRRFTPASIRRHYEAWTPYQFLAYWWELWSGYEQKHGPAHAWQPARTGPAITGRQQRASTEPHG